LMCSDEEDGGLIGFFIHSSKQWLTLNVTKIVLYTCRK
jgi:hypothetical protein